MTNIIMVIFSTSLRWYEFANKGKYPCLSNTKILLTDGNGENKWTQHLLSEKSYTLLIKSSVSEKKTTWKDDTF